MSSLVQNDRLDVLIREISALVSDLESEVSSLSSSKFFGKKIVLRQLDGNLLINDKIFPLEHKPLTHKLVQAFASSRNFSLSREELIQAVYLDQDNSSAFCELSPRLSESLYQNLLKLLSRARALFSETFTSEFFGFDVDWFVYDSRQQVWNFYQIL